MKYSRLTDGCCYIHPVVRKSEALVRYDGSRSFGNTNLIIHHSLANIIHQIVDLLCVLSVVQELRDTFLSCHWIQNLADIFQFPSDLRASASTLGLNRVGLPCQFLSPHFLLDIVFRSRCAERFNESFDSVSQRFHRLFVDDRSLGKP